MDERAGRPPVAAAPEPALADQDGTMGGAVARKVQVVLQCLPADESAVADTALLLLQPDCCLRSAVLRSLHVDGRVCIGVVMYMGCS